MLCARPVLADFSRAHAHYCFGNIWDSTIAPPSNLVSEHPEAPQPPQPDRALPYDTAITSLAHPHRGHLNHIRLRPQVNLQRGVIQISNRPMLKP